MYLAEYLGVDKFGELSALLTFISIASVVSYFGTNETFTKVIAQGGDISQVYREYLFFRFLLILVLFMIGYLYSIFIGGGFYILLLMLSIILSPFQLSQSVCEFYHKAKIIAISRFFVTTLFFSFKMFAIFRDLGIEVLMLITALEYLFVFILATLYVKLYFIVDASQAIEALKVRSIAILSLPFFVNSFVVVASSRVDQVMLLVMEDFSSLGVYSMGLRFSEFWLVLPSAIITLSMASLSSRMSNGSEARDLFLYLLMVNIMRFMFILSFFIIVVIFFVFEYILDSAFYLGLYIAILLMLSSLFSQMRVVTGKVMLLNGDGSTILKRSLSAILINIILNALLITLFGPIGAAIATLITSIYIGFLFDMISVSYKFIFKVKLEAFSSIFKTSLWLDDFNQFKNIVVSRK